MTNTCGNCEFRRATIHSKFSQCHRGYDYQGNVIFVKKTQAYVMHDSAACGDWKEYFEWMDVKIRATDDVNVKEIKIKWHTDTYVYLNFYERQFELRKDDLLKDGKRFPRLRLEFTLIKEDEK